jgi:hypothetical protein
MRKGWRIHSQIPGEIDVKPVLDRQVVTQELHGDDVQQSLQTIDSLGDPDGLHAGRNAVIVLIADDDGLRFPCGDLGEGGLHLGVKRIPGHDNDDGHVFVDESERTVFQFSSEDTCEI